MQRYRVSVCAEAERQLADEVEESEDLRHLARDQSQLPEESYGASPRKEHKKEVRV